MASHKLVRTRDAVVNGENVKVELRERRDGTRFEAVVRGGFLDYFREVETEEDEDAEG